MIEMAEKTVYLDSSALAKRYLAEPGTESIDELYHRAEARALRLAFSLWNIGEVLGAIAKAQRLGWISMVEAGNVAWAFVRETLKIRSLGSLRIAPVRGDLLADTIPLLFRHGLSQPDGLQITTCRDLRGDALVSADRRLIEAARQEGMRAYHPVADAQQLRAL